MFLDVSLVFLCVLFKLYFLILPYLYVYVHIYTVATKTSIVNTEKFDRPSELLLWEDRLDELPLIICTFHCEKEIFS